MDILLWIVFGLVVGLVAKLIMPGPDPGGIILTIVLGIVGAMLGGVSLGIFESVGHSLVLPGYEIPAFSQLKDVVAYAALVLVLIFRPTGILGERLAQERG